MRDVVDEQGLKLLADELACVLRAGDFIALYGDLGAGKTTFARFLITALLGRNEEIPSPTFSLVQTYGAPRMPVAHFDLYRLGDASEVEELGLEDALADGLVLVEWPERATEFLPSSRLEISFGECDEPHLREIGLRGHGDWGARLERFAARRAFLADAGWADTRIEFLQGDASARSYARLNRDGASALLMDSPAMPDGPPVRDGKPYSQVAHLAEDVRPFVAVAAALRKAGLCAPEIYAQDLERGFLLLEDFGNRVFGNELAAGASQEAMWRAGVNALVALRAAPAPERLPVSGGGGWHELPRYDSVAMQIELDLLPDWYWPMQLHVEAPTVVREEFCRLWRPVIARLQRGQAHWVLRDYHSPNLIVLAEREPPRDVGIIDFQDAMRGQAAYDLVSLLQDARVDVPASLEAELLKHYCTQVSKAEPEFDRDEFTFAYAAMGAQRNTKILGIFARLARRDGKPGYLKHMPRIWGYLERDLAHSDLAPLKAWYDEHLPVNGRAG